jgi:hypothetical protein
VHTDIPTRADLEQLLSVRDAACVSIYLPTAPQERGERDRIEFKNLSAEALEQLTAASIERDSLNNVREMLDDLADDDEFWARQAHSLAVFATPSAARTFQVANRLAPMVEVSDRFHVKPLLRSATSPRRPSCSRSPRTPRAWSRSRPTLRRPRSESPECRATPRALWARRRSPTAHRTGVYRAPKARRCACANTRATSRRPFGPPSRDSISR